MLQENCDYFSEKGSKCLNIEASIVATKAVIEEILTSKSISHCAMLGDSSSHKGKDTISAILDESSKSIQIANSRLSGNILLILYSSLSNMRLCSILPTI